MKIVIAKKTKTKDTYGYEFTVIDPQEQVVGIILNKTDMELLNNRETLDTSITYFPRTEEFENIEVKSKLSKQVKKLLNPKK